MSTSTSTPTAELIPSKYQSAFYTWVREGKGSCVVIAVAGSGKTTSALTALREIPPEASVRFFAFNTAIAQTLQDKIRQKGIRNVQASTFHSAGYRALCRAFGLQKVETNGRKLQAITRARLSWPDRQRHEGFACKLVSLAKGEGVGPLIPDTLGVWEAIVEHHDLDLDAGATEEAGIRIARQLLEWSVEDADKNYSIDFDDQLYLTCLWGLPLDVYDWVMVDEAQDTNPIRREILNRSLKAGGRLVAIGDPNQSIYGFTGASHDAIDLIRAHWDAVELPLSICYRCPTQVIAEAQRLVPAIEAAPGAPEGVVESIALPEALRRLQPGDAVLCRTNAPLVELAYQCLAQGIACQILGREIGKGLQLLIDKLKPADLQDLEGKLFAYKVREMQKYLDRDQPGKAQGVQDRVLCIQTIIDNLPEEDRSLQTLGGACDRLFGETSGGKLILSTIHKTKGMEFPRVAILRPDLLPGPWAKQEWEKDQERNLSYVAITRAQQELYYIHA